MYIKWTKIIKPVFVTSERSGSIILLLKDKVTHFRLSSLFICMCVTIVAKKRVDQFW